jgi:membrane-associated protease RseP (regulator of RpoE activity)
MLQNFVCTLMLLLACVVLAPAQDDLLRHGVIGLQVATADNTKSPGSDNPVVVQRVFEGSAAALAGFQSGDVIRGLDGIPATAPGQFSRAITRHLAGEVVHVAVTRGAQDLNLAAVLKPRPFETSPNADVLYRSVSVRGARRRVIVTRPKRPGPMPAVLFMQGLGCESIDGIDRKTGYGAVISALEERGSSPCVLRKPAKVTARSRSVLTSRPRLIGRRKVIWLACGR